MKQETAVISQEMLETFVGNKYHWKGLTPTVQMAMAKELIDHRRFMQLLKKYEAVNFGGQYANKESHSTTKP
tara:strand:+ start:515 stop:730 length:216 start_codon:yes stop_codon:yes gene_type:complete